MGNSWPGVLHHPPALTRLCPVRGINQVCRGKRKSPAMSYTALGLHSPRTWCKCPVRTQPCPSAWEKRDGATEAPIWDHLVSLSFAPAVPAPMNIPFGCKKKVSCSSEQSEGTWEQQDGVRAEETTGTSKGVTPVRLPICLTQHLWGKKHIRASGFCLKCHTMVQHISLPSCFLSARFPTKLPSSIPVPLAALGYFWGSAD